jgi:hypothetical protein
MNTIGLTSPPIRFDKFLLTQKMKFYTLLLMAFAGHLTAFSQKESLVGDSDRYVLVIRTLLSWYEKNYDKVNSIQLVDMPSLKGKTGWYKVNFDSVNKYLSVLRSSHFFSENYLNNARKYFQKCNKALMTNKQDDGLVDGIDFDLILFTQEPESTLEEFKTAKIEYFKSINKRDKIFRINSGLSSLFFVVVNDSNRLLIDNIDRR